LWSKKVPHLLDLFCAGAEKTLVGDFLPWFTFLFDLWVAGVDWRDEEARDSGRFAGGDGGWGLGLD
jgi:hypothetical protein